MVFILLPNTKMTKRRMWREKNPERDQKQKMVTKLGWLALFGTLLFGEASEWIAQQALAQERKQDTIELVVQAQTKTMPDKTISWDDAIKLPGIEPDPDPDLKPEEWETTWEWEEAWEWEAQTKEWKEKEKKLEIHGTIRWGSDVTPLLWSVLSDNPALMLTIDASNPQTWLWVSVIRADDFDKSMENPAWQATLVDLYRQKKFGNFTITWVWEYAGIDKLPGADSFTPIVWCTYDAWKWWVIDARAWHTFQEWEDIDVVRLWVTKQLNEGLSLAAQWFYRSDLSRKFYGRVQANVILGKWFWAQLSLIAQEWKLTPTAWVLYKF